jgi:hypothetical protein
MLSKEAFDLSHNFVVNKMTLYRTIFSNPLAVLDHLFFTNGNGYQDECEEKGMLAIFDEPIVTQEGIESKVRDLSSGILYDLHAHKYTDMSKKDIIEVIFADEIKEYDLEDLLESDFNLERNIETHFNKMFSVYGRVLEHNISDLIYFNSFGNSKYELYPFAYNDKRLMELVVITARYKTSLMEKLAEKANFNLEDNRHYIRSKELKEELEDILNNLKN